MEPMVSPGAEVSLAADEIAWVLLCLWAAVVLAYAAYRSRGEARPDPIRPPGPILRARPSSRSELAGQTTGAPLREA